LLPAKGGPREPFVATAQSSFVIPVYSLFR
jgi:hypothetical protein